MNERPLFEVKLTPIREITNTFRWMREHPGVRTAVFCDTQKVQRDYLIKYDPDSSPRYLPSDHQPDNFPGHIKLMTDLRTRQQVVAKSDTKNIGGSFSLTGNILEELNRTSVSKHPNVIGVRGLASDAVGNLFMVMDYLSKGDLLQWIKSNHSLSEISSVVNQLAAGLNNIHQKNGLVFADMKPHNVGFDSKGILKIFDFELSKIIVKGVAENSINGTPGYESPEQSVKSNLTIKSDIYSLAATIFSVFIEDQPTSYDVLDVRTTFELGQTDQIPFRNKYNSLLSKKQKAELSKVLYKSLSKNPEDRHKSVVDFNLDFQRALAAK